MAYLGDARRSVHVEAHVVVPTEVSLPAVQSRPDTYGKPFGSGVGEQLPLDCGGRCRGGWGARKDDEERVTFCCDLVAAGPLDRASDQPCVILHSFEYSSLPLWSRRVDPSMSVKRKVTVPVGS